MKEKEPVKIKLSTVLLIIAIIVIILMGVFIGFLYKKNIENIKSEDNNVNTENVEKTFSELEVKEALQNYLKISGVYQGSPYSVLERMKEITGKNVINDEYPEPIEDGEISILPTNIKYSEFKEFMLNYMTEELFNSNFSRGYVDKDGDLYCKTYGATGVMYDVESIEKENNSETKYKGKVYWYSEEDYKEKLNIIFEIENNHGKCVISSITFPDAGQEDVKENDDDKTIEQSKLNIKNYIGTWYESKKHTSDKNPNTLQIKSVDNNKITFDLYITRTANFDNVTVYVNNGSGTFEAITDNGPSKDSGASKVNGHVELGNNSIKMVIDKSNVLYLDSGSKYNFEYKSNEKNDDKKTNTSNANTSLSKLTSENNKDTTKNKIIGKWKADKVVDDNGNDIGLSAVWGTGIRYSNEMEFKADGILSYAIGITASSDDGKYTINGDTVKYGIPTDVKGNYDWRNAIYVEEEDIIKEEIDVVGEKAIVTYIRAD